MDVATVDDWSDGLPGASSELESGGGDSDGARDEVEPEARIEGVEIRFRVLQADSDPLLPRSSGAGPEVESGTAILKLAGTSGGLAVRLGIEGGHALLTLPAGTALEGFLSDLVAGPAGSVIDSAGVAYSVVAAAHEVGSRTLLVGVTRDAGWRIRVSSADGGPISDEELAVFRSSAPAPGSLPGLRPPPEADRVAVDFVDGRGELSAPPGGRAVFWVTAPGYSPASFRWSRRQESGGEVVLRREALFGIATAPARCDVPVRVEFYHAQGIWRDRPLHVVDSVRPGGELVGVPGGDFLVVVSATGAALSESGALAAPGERPSRRVLHEGPSTLRPGEVFLLELSGCEVERTLELSVRSPSAERRVDWKLLYLGRGFPGSGSLAPVASGRGQVVGPGSPAELSFDGLPLGYYAFEYGPGFFFLVDLTPGGRPTEGPLVLELPELRQYSVYLPERKQLASIELGEGSEDPSFVRVAVIVDPPDVVPEVPKPTLPVDASSGRIVDFLAPVGSLAIVSYRDGAAFEGGEVRLEEGRMNEVVLEERSVVDLSYLEERPGVEWFADVRVRSNGIDVTGIPLFLTDADGVSGVGVGGVSRGEIFVPMFPGADFVGGWYELPRPGTAVRADRLTPGR